jgi:hypothetical protein
MVFLQIIGNIILFSNYMPVIVFHSTGISWYMIYFP